MHPLIRKYPSQTFYENRITDDLTVMKRELNPLLAKLDLVFQRMTFFDLLNSQESHDETSKTNREEALFTLNLI
jgi:hypothetical protein